MRAKSPALQLLRKLRVDMPALEQAFDAHDTEASHYLDVQSGEVVILHEGLVKLALHGGALSPGAAAAAERTRAVLREVGRRYLVIPAEDTSDLWADMVGFCDGLDDPRLVRRLREGLKGPAAARSFFRVLYDAGRVDEWAPYHEFQRRHRVVDWLVSEGISPLFDDEF